MNFAIAAAVYALGLPLVILLFSMLHKKLFITRPMTRAVMKKKRIDESKLPKPIMSQLMKHLRFAMKDKRAIDFTSKKKKAEGAPPKSKIQRRFVFFLLYLAGLALAIASVASESVNWNLALLAAALFFVSALFAQLSSAPLIKARNKNLVKMFEIAQPHLGLDRSDPPEKYITITEWRDEYIPTRAEIIVPTNFSESGEEGFMRQFNQVFGKVSAWVPDSNPEKQIEGWDYEKGLVKLRAVPPLPMRADWNSKYVLHPGIAWCFFPLALGVENGVEIVDETTGKTEYILGLDFSGRQPEVGRKAGLTVSNKIVKTPQVLVGGGTGGGKAFDGETIVLRKIRDQSLATA